MTVKAKINIDKQKIRDKLRDKIISKGGKVPEETVKKIKRDWSMTSLRISKQLLKQVDALVEKREGLYRNQWILEAIQEKIKRDDKL